MVAYLLFLHFVADFVLQSREMGKRKSEYFSVLLEHLGIHGLVFAVGLVPFVGWREAITFAGASLVMHGFIDWYVWKLYKWSVYRRMGYVSADWAYWDDHGFYLTIGFDQLLHGITLVTCANYIL
jgi:hypothetical protein